MSAMQVFDFEGRAITAYQFRGRTCWIAQDVGRVLTYDDGGWRKTLGTWRDELVDSVDIQELKGPELREFLGSVGLTLPNTTRLSVLFESGLNLVCIKTDKPLGKKLRRFLAEKVLPALRQASDDIVAMRAEMVALNLRLTAGDNPTIWEAETVQDLCRLYRKKVWAPGERMPAWIQSPMGRIYKTILGDVVYFELKQRCPKPHDGELNYQFLTEARHKLMQRDMQTVAAFLRVHRTPESFFNHLRAAYRRAPLQLSWGP